MDKNISDSVVRYYKPKVNKNKALKAKAQQNLKALLQYKLSNPKNRGYAVLNTTEIMAITTPLMCYYANLSGKVYSDKDIIKYILGITDDSMTTPIHVIPNYGSYQHVEKEFVLAKDVSVKMLFYSYTKTTDTKFIYPGETGAVGSSIHKIIAYKVTSDIKTDELVFRKALAFINKDIYRGFRRYNQKGYKHGN